MNESKISIPISTELFLNLVAFLRNEGSDRDPVETVEVAIDYWIDNATWKQSDLMPELFNKTKGYMWKDLFLPNKTALRMKYKGNYHYASVEGDEIFYQETAVSPNEFADTIAGSSRNAWRCIEVRRPDDREWFLADHLRKNV